MKKIFYTVVFALVAFSLAAQQDAEYSMYFFNGMYVNPAYTGSKEVLNLSGLYRHQWVNIDGAPRSASIGVNSPLKKDQYAIGALYTYDQLGLTQTHSVYGSFAYRIRTKGTTKISLGLQAGFLHYGLDASEANTPSGNPGGDVSFDNNIKLFVPNFGAGIHVYNRKYYVGFSVPHILSNSLSSKLELRTGQKESKQYTHYLATAGYAFGKESSPVKFLPSVLFKFLPNQPLDADFTANFLFVDRFMLGASYRLGGNRTTNVGKGESIIGIARFAATNMLEFGYAYDYTLSNLNNFNRGTHEIFMGFNFSSDKDRFTTPRFVSYF